MLGAAGAGAAHDAIWILAMTALEEIINSDILVWARDRSGLSLEDVAKKAKEIKPDRLAKWEAGEAAPTPRQGRILAKIYDRPFLEFFSSHRPVVQEPKLVPDFRPLAEGASSKAERRSLEGIQQWAEEQRLNALDLIEEIGEQPPDFSDDLKFSIEDSVDAAAKIARKAINFPIEKQLELRSSRRAHLPKILRDKLEAMGILVLKASLKKQSIRGICLFARPLPVIVLGSEAAGAQAFTLMHEFGHILLRSSAISGAPQFGPANLTGPKATESWCTRFAASFLVPSDALESQESKPVQPHREFDLSKLKDLANTFSVSQHAMLIRLVNLGFVHPNFYWHKMRPIFLKKEAELKAYGRPVYYGARYVSRQGPFYTGLVLEAWGSGRISGHNAAEYMGIKKLSHLQDVREHFRVLDA